MPAAMPSRRWRWGTVVTDEGVELTAQDRYLREVLARGGSALSTCSYAYDLLRHDNEHGVLYR